ncbi:MAG: toll/interleukin-1 receptor domain-containing protein [Aggregatilineales bacterium]
MIVFISYSSKNRLLVNDLATLLATRGYEVRYDQQHKGGQLWWAEILKNIRECDVFLYALSRDCIVSSPCREESNYANALMRYILPVMIKPVDFKRIPKFIAERQMVTLTDPGNKEAQDKLFDTLEQRSKEPSIPLLSLLPNEPTVPISKRLFERE